MRSQAEVGRSAIGCGNRPTMGGRLCVSPVPFAFTPSTKQTSAAATEQQLAEARAQIAQLQQAAQEAEARAEGAKADAEVRGMIWDV